MSTAITRRPSRTGRACIAACLTVLAFALLGGAPVSAHTDFSSSTPADGSTVAEPVRLVTIVFTGEAEPVGDEFVALDADGQVRSPSNVSTIDDKIFTLTFDPPLAGGAIGVRWQVQAPDTHPIEGAFSFTVTAPPPTTTTAVSPSTTAPPEASATPTTEPAVVSAAPAVDPVATTSPPTLPPPDATAAAAPSAAPTLEEFLDVPGSAPGTTTATVGRVIEFGGIVLAIGFLAFAASTLRGSAAEVRAMLLAVRAVGAIIVIGAVIEFVGISRMQGEPLFDAWTTAPRPAALMRAAGGIAIAFGVVAATAVAGRRPGAGTPTPSLSAATVEASQPTRAETFRWSADRRSWGAAVGIALLTMSFWFDGHTISKGIRPVHAAVNSVHVLAGSVWVGGVIAMATVVTFRHRRQRPMRALDLVVRFSKVAAIASTAVIVAGGLMAVMVLDSFGDLTGTQWGKMLLLKTSGVGLAAIGGAYNHFRLLPALEADPDDPDLREMLRSTVTFEAIVLSFVVIVTAWLVSAAT